MSNLKAQSDHVTEIAHYELGYVGPKTYSQKCPAAIHCKVEIVYPRSSLGRTEGMNKYEQVSQNFMSPPWL